MRILIITLISLLVSSCSKSDDTRDGAPKVSVQAIYAPNPVPKAEEKSKFGNYRNYRVKGKTYHVLRSAYNYHKIGIASWYGKKFHGRLTSSREPYNMFALTAASKDLPIPCYVKVRNLANNKEVIVRVNDRGPFKPNRIMDLSYAAAQKIGMLKKGTAKVAITHINSSKKKSRPKNYSLSLGYYSNKTQAKKLLAKIKKYQALNKAYLIKNGKQLHLIIGPLTKNQYLAAKLQAKKIHIKVKSL